VSGLSATWRYDVVFNGNENHLEYEAALEANGTLICAAVRVLRI
jgi:hypothetical protein